MTATTKKKVKKKVAKKPKKNYNEFIMEQVSDDKLCYSEETWSWMNE